MLYNSIGINLPPVGATIDEEVDKEDGVEGGVVGSLSSSASVGRGEVFATAENIEASIERKTSDIESFRVGLSRTSSAG